MSENSQEIKISAALRGDSPEFSGSDSFHIAETDTAGDLGEATLKLTMIGTVPVGNDVDTNITKASNEQVTKPLAQGSFSAKTPITDYKICPVNAKEINDCTHSMDGMTISQSGEITVDASAVMTTKTTTHWVIAGDVFGYSVPSATGPKIIITAGDQPIGNNVKTLINTTPSTTIAPHDLEQGSFTSDDAPILDYKLCKMGATNPDDPTQCSTTMGTLKIDAESGKISGTSPAEGNVTDWIVARNKFGYSELKEGGPSVTVATGAVPQGDNVEQTADTTAKHDVTISFDSIPFSSPTAAISDYDICSSDGTQCGHTIDDVAIKIDKGTGKLTVSGTAPDATTTYAITATNKYGTSTPSATDGPRVTITIGLAPHGNNVEKSVGTTPSSPDPISATFKKGTFDNVTSASDYKICEIGATSSDQCSAVVNGLKITKNGDGSITVTGPAPPLAGDFTHSIIAINDYGSTEPSATGPRLTIHTGAVPIGKDVTVQPSGDVGPGDSIDLKVGSDTFSSTANITSYSLCSSSTDKSSCKTNLNGLSIDSNGHITGHAPTDSKGATLTERIVAMNEYGQSQLSNKSPKVVIDTYSTDGPTIVASANGHWPLDWDHANKYTETITVTPSKGNSLDPNSVYSIASSPKLDARGGSYFGFFYHVDNSGATKTAQKVIVTFKNSKFDGVTLPDYYYLTISDKRGHKTTVDPIITFG
ncbi:MAG: hypothetical protein GY821_08200 [Gammaproteobacteria bacterium]|nr:hypothetical protein [Gammaproteobacteria bacterium]